MREILFVTTSRHKVKEANEIAKEFGLKLIQHDFDYPENQDKTIEEIVSQAARQMADKLNQLVVVEDAGLFLEAYENFPGPLSKFVFNTIGNEGIFKLLEGKDRGAYFKAVYGYCQPRQEPKLFTGISRGQITTQAKALEVDDMPWDYIFIPAGYEKVTSEIMNQKKDFSARAKAVKKLAEYINSK
ncbi:MAG: non-canonical purine NTP pyrophosphatase [Candidatus Buchananbacteria bacterium CG10_big_fil_rev_8_21_14_0_10_42_9]|uniref:Non-canonical purine NTP pyrophosphatase n=1 Tax=Candidatus Buchananbacteria bacterium CG10_big_fil_rev_8_21_14_0_10_42_9 TaxID=1974526 RepID=A0A2H0W4H8_9BACT|nr:MAG: non-canonical purine NTP pyrophosphatase [Candidatus Buchananbacteria bacterium CG10_big_fil_rev_8_21_14_0_10_42_9]